jgi:hypothetical protein
MKTKQHENMWKVKAEDDNLEQEPLDLLDLPDNLRNDFVKIFATPEEYFTEDY